MKCLYCGKKLPIVKKLTAEKFCSVAHRRAFHDEQEKLGLARLLEDQQRKRPGRRSAPPSSPASADYLYEQVRQRSIGAQPWTSDLALAITTTAMAPTPDFRVESPQAEPAPIPIPIATPHTSVEEAMAALSASAGILAATDPVLLAHGIDRQISLPLEEPLSLPVFAEVPSDPAMQPEPLTAPLPSVLPSSGLAIEQKTPLAVIEAVAAAATLPFDLSYRTRPAALAAEQPVVAGEIPPSVLPVSPGAPELETTRPLPETAACAVEWDAQPPAAGMLLPQERVFPLAVTREDGPISLTRAAADLILPTSSSLLPVWTTVAIPAPPLQGPRVRGPYAYIPAVKIPQEGLQALADPGMARFAGAVPRLFSRPAVVAPRQPELAPSDSIPASAQRPGLPCLQYNWQARTTGKCQPFEDLLLYPEDFPGDPSTDAAPGFAFDIPFEPKARIASVRRSDATVLAKTFRSSRMVSISVHPDAGSRVPMSHPWQRPQKLPLIRPRLALQPFAARTAHTALSALSPFSAVGYRLSWEAVRKRWQEAPNDLRWIALAVPMIIGLVWFSGSPAAQSSARQLVPNLSGLRNVSFNDDSLEVIKANIQRRAAIELLDDFRQGLGDWAGVGDWSKGWTYDPGGFLRPRKLALYTPTLSLEDYRFEFLGSIERRALSWVFRAADIKNYHVARLEITRGGPLPTVELIRWTVINGRPGPRKSIPLPVAARLDTIYRVGVDVKGNDFVTTVQGQVVDVFTDERLPRGGVGFYSDPGEDARLRWVEVSHQYDMLGRLCAYLVPYNLSNPNARTAP